MNQSYRLDETLVFGFTVYNVYTYIAYQTARTAVVAMHLITVLLCLPVLAAGHASLVRPPSRAAMGSYGFPANPVDFQHNEGFCGGFAHQHSGAGKGRSG